LLYRRRNLTANEGYQENTVMLVFQTVSNALDSQEYKEQIREGVDNFGGINGGIVILWVRTVRN